MIQSALTKNHILLLTRTGDVTSDVLATRMHERHISFLRLDTGDFPSRITLGAYYDGGIWHGTLQCENERYQLESIKSVLYRRPTHYRMSELLPQQEQRFAEDEAKYGFGGVLRSLDCFWVSLPDAIHAAGYKPRQLRLAAELGLHVPRTLITNNPDEVQAFYEQCGGEIIFKTIHSGFLPVDGDSYDTIYTSRVECEHLAELDRVRLTANLFQERVKKDIELRITIIGSVTFPVVIYSQRSERTRDDWRAHYPDITYGEHYTLPSEVEHACRNLVERLGLNYGAIDMIVTPEGEHVFLEINPVGQYLWLEKEIPSLPLTDTLIDLLVRGSR